MSKTNKMACAPSKDQPGHPPSLIRVFTVRMKNAWVLSYPLNAQQRLIRRLKKYRYIITANYNYISQLPHA